VQEEYGDYGVSARRLLVIETCNYSNVKGWLKWKNILRKEVCLLWQW
jgi:hypothetical protein